MQPVKINLYISYSPEDRLYLEKLLRWLYPMQDEVNIWFEDPPSPPPPLPLPWQILLFWYQQPDPRRSYYRVMNQQFERAHIYLFLTSYKSLSNSGIEAQITRAVEREISVGARYLRIFPVILSPSRWKEMSGLARYKPLGPPLPLSVTKPEEEGFLELAEALQSVIQDLKRNLDERKYHVARTAGPETAVEIAERMPQPDLGEDPDGVKYQPDEGFRPPEWLGWVILLTIIILTISRLGPNLPSTKSVRYHNIDSTGIRPPEFLRENPLMPPAFLPAFPVADDDSLLFLKTVH